MILLQELLKLHEAPFGIYSEPHKDTVQMSKTKISQDEKLYLEKFDIINNVDFYFKRENSEIAAILGIIDDKIVIELLTHEFRKMQHETGFHEKYAIFIKSIITLEKFRRKNIIEQLYLKLASSGYLVFSDKIQFIGAINLWKKLAKNSKSVGLQVRLWNTITKDWARDPSSKVIVYNGEKDIWTRHSGPNLNLHLVLTGQK